MSTNTKSPLLRISRDDQLPLKRNNEGVKEQGNKSNTKETTVKQTRKKESSREKNVYGPGENPKNIVIKRKNEPEPKSLLNSRKLLPNSKSSAQKPQKNSAKKVSKVLKEESADNSYPEKQKPLVKLHNSRRKVQARKYGKLLSGSEKKMEK